MIETPTLFVLGAGASVPYGYPTGEGLKEHIVEHFPSQMASHCNLFNRTIYDHIWRPQVLQFVEGLEGAVGTIDEFLSTRPTFAKLGKAAILLAMFQFEKDSVSSNKIKQKKEDWFSYLYDEMTSSHNEPGQVEFGMNPIAFISFNYDRVIEYKLFDASIHKYGVEYESRIIAQIQKIPLIHVYGKIADLPYQSPGQSTDFVLKYGTFSNKLNLLASGMIEINSAALDRLQIVNEERDTISITEEIHDTVKRFERIIFLGFGYHKENMEILGFPQTLKKHHRLLGTCYDLKPREIQKRIHAILTDPPVPHHHRDFADQTSKALEYLRLNL